jgi:hypothetical protein
MQYIRFTTASCGVVEGLSNSTSAICGSETGHAVSHRLGLSPVVDHVALSQADPFSRRCRVALFGWSGWLESGNLHGLPGGKTKTIAVDLSGVLTQGDGRLRIATTMEFYWDHIFFTLDDPPTDVRTTELELISADLHERGYSRVVPGRGNAPEQFFYDQCSREPKWPPMHGAFTRLGDVKPLLDQRRLARDDGSGRRSDSEVPCSSRAAADRMARDFFVYNAGWEKDCNVLTWVGPSSRCHSRR